MIIKVLGVGCSKCHKLEESVRDTLKEMKVDAELVKVTSIPDIMKYKIIMTPGLVINEEVVCAGRIPEKEELKEMIERFAEKEKGEKR